jgi:hypothetical protein
MKKRKLRIKIKKRIKRKIRIKSMTGSVGRALLSSGPVARPVPADVF